MAMQRGTREMAVGSIVAGAVGCRQVTIATAAASCQSDAGGVLEIEFGDELVDDPVDVCCREDRLA
jgi:hypothetical protein